MTSDPQVDPPVNEFEFGAFSIREALLEHQKHQKKEKKKKKHPGLFCVGQVGVNRSRTPFAVRLTKLLPVKELHNDMTNVSNVRRLSKLE